MKKKVLFTIAVAVGGLIIATSGCSTPPAQHEPSASLRLESLSSIEPSTELDYANEPVRLDVAPKLKMKEIPPDWGSDYDFCGYMPPGYTAQWWIDQAELVYTFTGISETWVPINGEPTQYYIYSVR